MSQICLNYLSFLELTVIDLISRLHLSHIQSGQSLPKLPSDGGMRLESYYPRFPPSCPTLFNARAAFSHPETNRAAIGQPALNVSHSNPNVNKNNFKTVAS